MKLYLTNSLTGSKELFKPLNSSSVKLYVCGITPYDYAHIGHGRVFVTFDLLYRFLIFLGYDVTYCRNFTDIDDKLLKKAAETLGDPLRYKEIAQRFMTAFSQEMHALNCLAPTYEPRVTDYIPQIITFIEGLVKKGKAYVVDGDVYFSIATFPEYGALSKQKLDELRAGARVQVDERKKDPLDFALWKAEQSGTFWKSPWGYGRPGWHIECSAMAKELLADQIDIHGGGADLIFPHHENEIAQSQGLIGKKFAQYWLHCAFVRINQEKMSKSVGNVFLLKDILTQIDPMVLRYYYLAHHYRSPLDFSLSELESISKTYQKLCTFFVQCTENKHFNNTELEKNPITKRMLDFLCDDLNTPGMLGVVFTYINQDKHDLQTICAIKYLLQEILGLTLKPLPEKSVTITPEIEHLLAEREKARIEKNWQRADELREKLRTLGVDVHDKKL